MAHDVDRQIIRIVQQTNFSLQFDETCTRENESLFVAYVKFIFSIINSLCAEFLFSDGIVVNAMTPQIIVIHCALHRANLVAK